jgi:hypothetical protein
MGSISQVKDDPVQFDSLKKELSNVLARIKKFNLIPLTFTTEFWDILYEKTPSDFVSHKLTILNELHFELHECLYTDRLRYGGELMYYLFELKLTILKLPIDELIKFETILKEPAHYYLRTNVKCSTDEDKKKLIQLYKKEQKEKTIQKAKVSIKEKSYSIVESSLKKALGKYNDYIAVNFPTISKSFTFYNKNIRAYLTGAISKEILEFRIHSYESSTKNSSITLLRQYYDFYPAYFFNLEEISDKQVGATVTTLYKADFNFHNVFTEDFIFGELINIYISNAGENEIKTFIHFLLKCHFHKIQPNSEILNLGFDIYAEKEQKKYAYEIYHRKNRSSDKIFQRIQEAKNISSELDLSFIFTTYPGDLILKQLKNSNIKALYISDMIEKIKSVGNTEIIERFIKVNLKTLTTTQSLSKSFEGEDLIRRLRKCPPGDKHWSEYETIGIDIFRFLFEDTFQSYIAKEQAETDLKNHRRDLVVSNYFKDATSFWAAIKQSYHANAIIVDFKNYSGKLNSNNYFVVSKYTTKKVGNFALVFSRNGLDNSALLEQKSLYTGGKLLIEFSDRELVEMIQEKIIGKDPLDRLKSKEFEIITS